MFQESVEPSAAVRSEALETMRAIAVLLLVSYHVIGSDKVSGLDQAYPAPLRIFADFLIDIRMPFFAFIAGYVYGLRPVGPGQYRSFIAGKIRRLYIPGVIAALLYALTLSVTDPGAALPVSELWMLFVLPYKHYWFLQAILVLFLVFGAIDMRADGRATPVLFVAFCLISLLNPYIPGNPMSANQAIYLAPFFLWGVIFCRFRPALSGAIPGSAGLALLAMLAATWINISEFHQSGQMSMDRQDLQSLVMGLSACLLAILVLPHIPQLEQIGPYAFTIYLYHVFGTAGMRRMLHALGIEALTPHLILGMMAGIAGPVALHLAANRFGPTRRWLLGKRR